MVPAPQAGRDQAAHTGTSCEKPHLQFLTLTVTELVSQALLVDGVLNISRQYAQKVFADRDVLNRTQHRTEKQQMAWKRAAAKCEVFLELDRLSALPFRLHEVVKDVSESGEHR